MAHFCTNCGTRLEDNYNFCTNCGSRIDKSDIKHNMNSSNSPDSLEKRKARQKLNKILGGPLTFNNNFKKTLESSGLDYAQTKRAISRQVTKEINSGVIKTGGVEYRVNQLILEHKVKMEKQKAEERKKLELIDRILESEEIKSEMRKNSIGPEYVPSIKENLKIRIIDKKENMSADEIRDYIKGSIKSIKEKKQPIIIKETEIRMPENEIVYGGRCGPGCSHYYEEYLDSMGSIVGDFDAEGYYEYYCNLGHPISHGRICKDYK